MARQEFEVVVAAAPRESMVKFEQLSSGSIAASGSEAKFFYAPAGFIVEVKAIFLDVPAVAGATSGSQTFIVGYTDPTIDMMAGNNAYNNELRFTKNTWDVPGTTSTPSDVNAYARVLDKLVFDSTHPLLVNYFNSTNAAQAGQRIIRIWGLQRQVV